MCVLIHIIKMLSVVIVLVVCINRIVVADDQCVSYEFETPFFPGISCEDIYKKNLRVVMHQDTTGLLMVQQMFIVE